MSQQEQEQEMSSPERLKLVFEHLQMESLYLDTVIESGLEIQEILRQQRNIPTGVTGDQATAAQQETRKIMDRLGTLRENISERFLPVLEARKKLPDVLKTFVAEGEAPPSLTSLFFLIDDPYRSQLKVLRDEIRKKLDKVYSITMGNQTVLIYTLNYYDVLLNGNQPKSDCYNANGIAQSQTNTQSTFIATNC